MKRKLILPLLLASSALSLPAISGTKSTSTKTKPTQSSPAPRASLAWGDLDGDGLDDLLVIDGQARVTLYMNFGDGRLEDVTETSGLGASPRATCALITDLDGDGRDDLYLGSSENRIWRNLGNGMFEPSESGIEHDLADYAIRATARGEDGLPDLQITTEAGELAYRNLGAGTFELWGPNTASPAFAVLGESARATFRPVDSHTAAQRRIQRWSLSRSLAPTGSASPLVPSGVGGSSPAGLAPLACLPGIRDASGGACLNASSVPSVGTLYPLSTDFYVDATTGNVGLGTTNPTQELTVFGSNGIVARLESSDDAAGVQFASDSTGDISLISPDNSDDLHMVVGGSPRMVVTAQGRVGIGPIGPNTELELAGAGTQRIRATSITGSAALELLSDNTGLCSVFSPSGTDDLLINTGGTTRLSIDASGLVSVKETLEIRGGADIVERFESSCGELEPGTVVVIDPENPGALTCSFEAYDTKVAGVVSGAGGVQPGLCLGQDGVLDGDTSVAMTGRVFVKCSTENGAIRPGDRLTTAGLAGHAMKVTDNVRSVGTVIGKAMSSLDEETGLVLVLVNLQ